MDPDHACGISRSAPRRLLIGLGLLAAVVATAGAVSAAYATFYGPTALQGDVAAAGVGVRATGSGTITMAAVPPGATVVKAYAYWVLQSGPTPAPGSNIITFAGTPVTGAFLGTDSGLCWSTSHSHAFRADVTSLVTGSGTYTVTVVSGLGTLSEGVSLVVVYDVGSGPWREVVIVDGYDAISGASATATIPRSGGASPASSNLVVMGADGQPSANEDTYWNSVLLAANTWDGSDPMTTPSTPSALWDTDAFAVSSIVGSNTLKVTSTGDCLGPEAFTLSTPVPPPGCPPGTVGTPPLCIPTTCPPPSVGVPPACVTPPPPPPGSGLDASGAYNKGCLGYGAGPERFIVSHGLDPVSLADSDAVQCTDSTGPSWVILPNANVKRSQAAGTLIRNTGMPVDGYWVVGGKGPTCTFGSTGNICADVERLQPAGPVPPWVMMPPLPVPAAGLGAAVDFKHIYVMGGRDCDSPACTGAPYGFLQVFSFGTGMWGMGAPMPSPRADLAVAQTDVPAGCTEIYAIGGNQGPGIDLPTIDAFNTCTMSWTPGALPPMPVAVSNAVAGWCGPTLVVVGGTNGGSPTNIVQRYNTPSSPGAWDPPATMSNAGFRFAVSGNEDHAGGSTVQMAAYPGDPSATNTC